MPLLVVENNQWVDANGEVYPWTPPEDTFVSGLSEDGETPRRGTQPTPENTGVPPGTTLRPYDPLIDGSAPNGILTITQAGRSITGVDFGNIKVRVRAPNVTLDRCLWRITHFGGDIWAVDFRSADNTGGGRMTRCTVINDSQEQVGSTGVFGWNLTIDRCHIEDFVDQVGAYVPGSPGLTSLPIGLTILDTYLGPVAWFCASTGGVVHPSDWKSHSDNLQVQGGYGWQVINTTLYCHYSARIGTGTPGSGSEHGWATEYTQAQGETERFAFLLESGARTHEPDGTILGHDGAGIMVNAPTSKGNVVEATIAYCWGSGGSYWLNTASANQGHFGSVYGCRVQDNQKREGRALVIPSHMTVDFHSNEWVDTNWQPTGSAIPRRTA